MLAAAARSGKKKIYLEDYVMKKYLTIVVVAGVVLIANAAAQAAWTEFWFSEEDLWNHTTSSDTRLYNQDAPRRHHTAWKSNVGLAEQAT